MTKQALKVPATVPEGMVFVPAGKFRMGSDGGYAEERPAHEVQISSFAMDRYPVTNGKYREFCDATDRTYPDDPRWERMPGYFLNYPEYPVVNVSYRDAYEYARWAGKRLPTEAEWEYAALGGAKGTVYPWGNGHPGSDRAQYSVRESGYAWNDWRYSTGHKYTAPVGSFPPNNFGLYDMAGNVWEWCENWYYRYPWEEVDDARLGEGWGGQRVLRGGAFYSPVSDLRVSRRVRVFGGTGTNGSGFRCVMDLESSPALTAPRANASPKATDETWKSKLDTLRLKPRQGVELCLGIGPNLSEEDAERIRNLGFTSVEQYVTWETVENAGEGIFDFSVWDEQVRVLKKHDLRWVPFLIAGPAYSLPDWYRRSDEFRGLVCLEHRLESGIQSIWDVRFHRHIERFVAAFAERYRDQDVIESLLLGITGDFGEAIFPVWGGSWTFRIPGTYHTHGGYWCGDKYATADFRESILRKYNGEIDAVNASWGTSYLGTTEIDFPNLAPQGSEGFRVDEPTAPGEFPIRTSQDRHRWLDFIEWYRDSMTNLADAWLGITRKHFPGHAIYLCTGGDAPPHHGAHFGDQCRVAAKHDAGVRITNEASNYGRNFFLTHWVASAGRHYGAYFGFEPAGGINEQGVACRIYNATVTGAKNLHFYYANIFGSQETVDAWTDNFKHIFIGKPDEPAAILYPDSSVMLGEIGISELASRVANLRSLLNFDFCDDGMVATGALKRYKLLMIVGGQCFSRQTLDAVLDWVRAGGLLIGFGTEGIYTVGGDDVTARYWDANSGEKTVERGASLWIPGVRHASDVRDKVAVPMRLWLSAHGFRLLDSEADAVYAASLKDRIMLLNGGDKAITKSITMPDRSQKGVRVGANSILEVELE